VARLIVTRPAGQAQALTDSLIRQGHTVTALPLMRITPQDTNTPALRQRLLDLDNYHKIISISANASRLGLDAVDTFWPQCPVGLDWFAVGPGSAEALLQFGLEVTTPSRCFDSEGLLALPQLQQVAGDKILIWRGVGGREVLAKTLRERGASVDYAELYQREEHRYEPSVWQQALTTDTWLVLSSGQALQIIEQQVPDLPQRIAGLILPSERVADQARNKNYHQVLVPASARDDDVLSCIQDSL